MRIKNTPINPNYSLMKASITETEDAETKAISKKLDETSYGYIYPPVSQILTDYVLKNNDRLGKCTMVLSQDTVLQDYIFKDTNGDNVYIDKLNFWNKKNKYNYYLANMERYQYGFGVCEVIFNNLQILQDPKGLVQIPAKTMLIQKENDTYYAVQMNNGVGIKTFRIYNLLDTYPETDNDLPVVLWLGGGTTHRFYDIPVWYPVTDKILGQINLNLLNAQQLNDGNNISGVLNISGPPQRPNALTGMTVEQQLREQMQKTGTGILVSYLESPNKDFPLNFEFINISNNNWDYLENFTKSVDDSIMSVFSIPKVRLMIDDTTESMNSKKSDTIWQIYAISLDYEQFPNELLIQEFNNLFFDLDLEVDMQVPIFSDKRQIELTTVKELFNSALLTLGQAIVKVAEFYPELSIDNDLDMDNPVLKERYFNGTALGFGEYTGDVTEPSNKQYNDILNLFNGL